MGDRIGVQLPLRENLSQFNQPPRSTQPGHPFVGRTMSTGQMAVMLCDWGVKADMVLFAGNTVWSISERVRGVCVDALYKSTFTLLYLCSLMVDHVFNNLPVLPGDTGNWVKSLSRLVMQGRTAGSWNPQRVTHNSSVLTITPPLSDTNRQCINHDCRWMLQFGPVENTLNEFR